MQTVTQPMLAQADAASEEQFLIVPVFFKKQIEAIISASSPKYAFGFFYGDEKENYRIIKKIWPVSHVANDGSKVKITKQDFIQASLVVEGTNLKLLGCFFTSENGNVSKALLSESHADSFSFVKLKENNGQPNHTWIGSICQRNSREVLAQKVIL
jgi:tRNA G10  N-methylase Trm11